MGPSYSTPGDAMAPGWFWGHRTKYIHAVGVTAKVKYVPEDNNDYTGFFQGAEKCIMRFSTAGDISSLEEDATVPFAPGFGLKCLRDGVDSANTMAVSFTGGTPGDWNPFSPDLDKFNHIGPIRLMGYKFYLVTDMM